MEFEQDTLGRTVSMSDFRRLEFGKRNGEFRPSSLRPRVSAGNLVSPFKHDQPEAPMTGKRVLDIGKKKPPLPLGT